MIKITYTVLKGTAISIQEDLNKYLPHFDLEVISFVLSNNSVGQFVALIKLDGKKKGEDNNIPTYLKKRHKDLKLKLASDDILTVAESDIPSYGIVQAMTISKIEMLEEIMNRLEIPFDSIIE